MWTDTLKNISKGEIERYMTKYQVMIRSFVFIILCSFIFVYMFSNIFQTKYVFQHINCSALCF